MTKIKVLIADDNSFIREGMKIILSSFEEFEVVATVENGQEAVQFCQDHEVDVALLDIRMPVMSGVEATRIIAAETGAKPLILTTFDDDEFIIEAIRAGARGYLLKNNDPEQIRDAIKSVHNNHHVLQGVIVDWIKTNLPNPGQEASVNGGGEEAQDRMALPNPAANPVDPDSNHVSGQTLNQTERQASGSKPACIDESLFTERELAVMAQIAKGFSNKGIAKKLFISEGTVANHITSILNKTGLEHRTQIAIYYLTGEVMMTDE